MSRFHTLTAVAICALALTACNNKIITENAVSMQLPAVEQPARAPGTTQVLLRDGNEVTYTLIAIDAGLEQWKTNEGCVFTNLDMFAPTAHWRGCGPFANGAQEVTRNGTPWPIVAGHAWSYQYSGSNDDGNRWSGTRTCKVDGAVRIPNGDADHDTHKVVCDDPHSTRTFYISPASGEFVQQVRYHKRSGETTVLQSVVSG